MTDQAGDVPFWDLERYRRDHSQPAEGTGGRHDGGGRDGGRDGGGRDGGGYGYTERKRPVLKLKFTASGGVLFLAALRGALFSILTLGLHRFWMITRLRRFYWSGIRIDGDPLEYTGRGIEKLLGFLFALVVLAAYLGAVQLGLTFLGLSFAADDPAVLQASLQLGTLAAIPLIFFATYRAQRYLLARTRWRGIRFGLGPGALGYTRRALLLSLLTLLTLGLAYPYQHYRLAKYVTDRAYFGDLEFTQEGGWGELFAQWIWIYIIAGFCGLMLWGLIDNPQDAAAGFLGAIAITFGATALLLAYQRYTIAAFRILWNNRYLGDSRFECDLSAGRVLWIYFGGGFATSLCTALVGGGVAFLLISWGATASDLTVFQQFEATNDPAVLWPAWPIALAGVVSYLVLLSVGFAFGQLFVSLPVLRAKVEATRINDPQLLALSRQREADRAGEAGGFADALGVDVGAGI
ncbi:MAG: DUF898 family protein [Pseudomonadota bacterium]